MQLLHEDLFEIQQGMLDQAAACVHAQTICFAIVLTQPSMISNIRVMRQGSGSVLATRNLHVLRRLVAADTVRAAAALTPHGGTLMALGDLRAAMAVPLEVRQQLTASQKVCIASYNKGNFVMLHITVMWTIQ